jgi:glycosyltransferase involved in cell wall biosynthesis
MKLIFVTQVLDPNHGSLAQTLDLVAALAIETDELVVLCREDRWGRAPAGVEVRTYEARTRGGRALAYQRQLAASIDGADAILAHMVPTFLVLAAPLARVRRVPLLLWYTHWHAGRMLRAATALCTVALSVDPASYPIASPKVRGIGHAIDVDVFTGEPAAEHAGPLRFLAVGRTARWKGLATLLQAFALATGRGLDATLEIRGPSLTADERAHREELVAAIDGDDRLRDRASMTPPVSRAEVPALIAGFDVVVNPVEPSSGAALDKVVYEAGACERVVVTTNPALAPFLNGLPVQLLARPHDPEALADVLIAVGAAGPEVRATVGAELRRRVVADHSLDHWAKAVIQVIREVRSGRVSVRSGRRPTA